MNPILFKISNRTLLPICLFGILLLVAGCGNGKLKLSNDQRQAFDGAPADVKAIWEKALTLDQAHDYNDYTNAEALLDSLQQKQLTDQQSKALRMEMASFHQHLWEAAEKNDPAATKAVLEINKSKSRR
jgi:hypothetical protein